MSDEIDIEELYEDVEPEKKCRLCDIVLPAVGLLIAGLFAYMAIDVLSGGKLTGALGLGRVREVIEEEE